MKPTYPLLSPYEFGATLLRTQDLDPVYVALHAARQQLATPQVDRLLVAYFCLYHLGAAAWIAERTRTTHDFCHLLQEAALNRWSGPVTGKRYAPAQIRAGAYALPWPRGSERRHWRGQQAVASAEELTAWIQTRGGASALLDHWAQGKTFVGVTGLVKRHRGFGPWIAFKVADVLERVRGNAVDFRDCELGFYDEPRKGALYMAHDGQPPEGAQLNDAGFREEVAKWTKRFSRFRAPPDHRRAVNVQEVETIFCKYKSHCGGHYPPGKDTREVLHGLQGWGSFAEELRRHVQELPYAKDPHEKI